MYVACWGRTTHVGGPDDAGLQGYRVSSVLCHRFVTVTAAQKISYIFKSGRPASITNPCMFARARARRGRGDQIQIAARFKLLLQNGRVKHRGLLRVIDHGGVQPEASVGTV